MRGLTRNPQTRFPLHTNNFKLFTAKIVGGMRQRTLQKKNFKLFTAKLVGGRMRRMLRQTRSQKRAHQNRKSRYTRQKTGIKTIRR